MAAKRAAVIGLMTAMVIVLLVIEQVMPPLPFLPPGFRLGVSNIVVMYAVIFIGKKEAFMLVGLKALFNAMRGVMAGVLSFCGGFVAVCAVIFFARASASVAEL
jgi:heptaprenyl diphosphate synthase